MNDENNAKKIQKRKPRGTKEKTTERRNKILKIIIEYGYWNIDKKKLAEMFGVSLRQIYNDIKFLSQHHDLDDINNIRFLLTSDLRKAEKEIRKILNDPAANSYNKLRAAGMLIDFVDKFTKFLENYGFKEKIADKLEIVGNQDYDELIKLYNERTKSKD